MATHRQYRVRAVGAPRLVPAGRGTPRRRSAPVQVGAGRLAPPATIVDLPEGQAAHPFDQDETVRLAVESLQTRYAQRPDPAGLLAAPFTLLRLRALHETVAGRSLQRDTFRQTMLPFVEPLDEVEQGAVGRPARLYRRSGDTRRHRVNHRSLPAGSRHESGRCRDDATPGRCARRHAAGRAGYGTDSGTWASQYTSASVPSGSQQRNVT